MRSPQPLGFPRTRSAYLFLPLSLSPSSPCQVVIASVFAGSVVAVVRVGGLDELAAAKVDPLASYVCVELTRLIR